MSDQGHDYVAPFREPLAPGTRLHKGQYRLSTVIGQGNFSITYAAQQRPGKLPVAIKEFFPLGCWRENFKIVSGPECSSQEFADSVQDFMQEGSYLQRFNHPGIVRIFGIIKANQTAYLVEELLEGLTLGQGIEGAGSMSLDRVLEAVLQIGTAMIEVHEAGLLHSDLKPDNLFLTQENRYVLLDFGTAQVYGEKAPIRQVATVSPGYSPIEQYQASQRLTPAADVYALACTVYHLLQGYPPPDSLQRSQGASIAPLENIPEQIRQALNEAMQLHPLRRTPRISQFLHQLGLTEHGPYNETATTSNFQLQAKVAAHLGITSLLHLDRQQQILYSGGKDGRICQFSWPNLKPGLSQAAHRGAVTALAVSGDGGHLVSGGQDGAIKLWSTGQGPECHWLVSSGPPVRALYFQPDSSRIIAALADGNCHLLAPLVEHNQRYACLQGSLRVVALHPNGRWLAIADDQPRVELHDLTTGKALGQFICAGQVRSLCFNNDGSGLLISSGNCSVELFDVESYQQVRSFLGQRCEALNACFSHDQKLLITVSADSALYGYHTGTGRLSLHSSLDEGMTATLVSDPDRALLASGSADGHIHLWAY